MRVNARDKQFGATGRGVTDDTRAIQRAINFVGETGGRVIIPGGNYLVDEGPLVMSSQNAVTIEGDGYATLLRSTKDRGVLRVDQGRHNVRDVILQGCRLPNASSVVADVRPSAIETLFDRVWIDGGGICLHAGAVDASYRDLVVGHSYGTSMILVTAGCWFHRGKFDPIWPVAQPIYGATLGDWQASTGYDVGHVRVLDGYYVQCSQAGVSGAVAPALKGFFEDIVDGTCRWLLACGVARAIVQLDTGCVETSWHNCDLSGAGLNAVAALDSTGAGSPSFGQFHHCIFSQTIGDNVLLDRGSHMQFRACRFGGTVITGSHNMRFTANFGGTGNNCHVTDSQFMGGAAGSILNQMTGGKAPITRDNI